jgi:hypothetical protein
MYLYSNKKLLSLCESLFKHGKVTKQIPKYDYVKDHTKSNLIDTMHIYNQIYNVSKHNKNKDNIKSNKNLIYKKF